MWRWRQRVSAERGEIGAEGACLSSFDNEVLFFFLEPDDCVWARFYYLPAPLCVQRR